MIDFSMGGYFVCLILPVGFIMMTAGLHSECEGDRKVAANIGLILAAVYSTFIMLVYFSQLTTVNNEQLNEQAATESAEGLLLLSGVYIFCLSEYFHSFISIPAKNKC